MATGMLGRLFGSAASPADADPCRRLIQVRHSERLSGIPTVLTLIATLGRSADFRVALPHVAGSSLVEATRAPSSDGAPRLRPTMPLSAYVTMHPDSQAMHSACDALGRPAINLVFAKRDDPSVTLESPAKWCPGDSKGLEMCIFDWTPCDANSRKRAETEPKFKCPGNLSRKGGKQSTPIDLVVSVLRAAFALMEKRYPPSRRPVAPSYAPDAKGSLFAYAAASSAPTLVLPGGQGWYKDIGGLVKNRTAPFAFQSLSPALAKVVDRIEKLRTGCKATGGVSAAAMFRLLRNGPRSKLVRSARARTNALARTQADASCLS